MPTTTRVARACALALAGLGLAGSTMSALPATAAPGAGQSDRTTSTRTTSDDMNRSPQDRSSHDRSAKRTPRKHARTSARLSAKRRVDSRVLAARNIAMRQRGDAYAYGAAGPDRFDCSGLIRYSYSRAGFAVPRTSRAQAAHARRIAKGSMRSGDLMFFYGGGGVYHAAIFLRWVGGKAQMLHAPGTGQRVRVATAWTPSWFGGTLRRA
ncbi:C40 family peptidase [Nocardioides sp. zg-1228]|uniref:C40 family peptidase n=1 Tax=Nocardioides sp. zg-1228 TaxID=2763008 RepID=UPI0016435E0C|nr:C40 family peptidase [Nocardioides sp. zg-1228]MBC2933111.1 C40 family peptidase [Nocardioides sp. zg-1228]QSF56703.1 C40 family peptidase [Nocardioides sp. zg-1228]